MPEQVSVSELESKAHQPPSGNQSVAEMTQPENEDEALEALRSKEMLLRKVEQRIPIFGGITPPQPFENIGIPIVDADNKTFDHLHNDALLVHSPDEQAHLAFPPTLRSNSHISPGEELSFIGCSQDFCFPTQTLPPDSSGLKPYFGTERQLRLQPKDRYVSNHERVQKTGQHLYVNVTHTTRDGASSGSIAHHGIHSIGEAIVTIAPIDPHDYGFFNSETDIYLFHVPFSDVMYQHLRGEGDGLSLSHQIPASLIPIEVNETYPHDIGELNYIGGPHHLPAAYIVGKWPTVEGEKGQWIPGKFEVYNYQPPSSPEHLLLYTQEGELIKMISITDLPLDEPPANIGHIWAMDGKTNLVYRYFHNPDIKPYDPYLGFRDYQQLEHKPQELNNNYES